MRATEPKNCEKNLLFSLICIRFGTCKVRRLNRAFILCIKGQIHYSFLHHGESGVLNVSPARDITNQNEMKITGWARGELSLGPPVWIGLLLLAITWYKNPPCWRASSLLFPHWDIKRKRPEPVKLDLPLFWYPSAGIIMNLPSSMADFCTTWSLAAKGLLLRLHAQYQPGRKTQISKRKFTEVRKHSRCACSRSFFGPGWKNDSDYTDFSARLAGLKILAWRYRARIIGRGWIALRAEPFPCNRQFDFKRICFRRRPEISARLAELKSQPGMKFAM